MLFISKYTTCIQRWARKLLSRSARAKWLPPVPSEVEVAQLCSILLQKITAKVGPAYCLNLVQLSKGIPSFLVALVLPGTHLQGLQKSHGSVPCCAMCQWQCHRRCQGQPILVFAPMVIAPTTPGEQQASTPQPHAARRARLCPPLLLTSSPFTTSKAA